jgi:GTP cyclohydrolase I
MDWQQVYQGVTQVLLGLGLDPTDPNFTNTPDRVTRAYQEMFAGLGDIDYQIGQMLESTFPCAHSQMIVARDVECYSLCPHHLLPVHYRITVGYLPGDDAQVLGLSKLPRLVTLLSARPVLQEQVVNDITSVLMRVKGCIGAGCIAHGEHYCVKMRGIKSNASVVTSSMRGAFLEIDSVRSEFMMLAQ